MLLDIYEDIVQNIAFSQIIFTLQQNRRLLNLSLVNQVKVLAMVPSSLKKNSIKSKDIRSMLYSLEYRSLSFAGLALSGICFLVWSTNFDRWNDTMVDDHTRMLSKHYYESGNVCSDGTCTHSNNRPCLEKHLMIFVIYKSWCTSK